MDRKTSRLEPFDDRSSLEEQETQRLAATNATDARGIAPSSPTDATLVPTNPETTPSGTTHPRLIISRRNLLIAGGGLVVVGGGALGVAKETHLASHIRNALLRIYDHTRNQVAAHQHGPQPLPDGPMQTPHDLILFDGTLEPGWADYSWADRKIPEKSVTYENHPVMQMTLGGWAGLQFHHSTFNTIGFGYFQCWVRGIGRGGQDVKVFVVDDLSNWLGDAYLGDYTQGGSIAADTWRLVRIPLQALAAVGVNAQAVIIQAFSGQAQGQVYLADLRFVYHPDLQPAGIKAVTSLDLSTISLRFEEPFDAKIAANVANYLIAAAAGTNDPTYTIQHPVAPSIARYYSSSHTVSMTLPKPLHDGGKYTVAVSPMKDTFGVATKAGLKATVQVTSEPITLATDVAASRHAISPDIFGNSQMDPAQAHALGVTLLRWGGEINTRYNWKLGSAWNTLDEPYSVSWENTDYGANGPRDKAPGGAVDGFFESNHAHGINTLVTIPTIGWVAKDTNPNSKSIGVPDSGGPPLKPNGDAIKGYDPTANRQRTSVASRARKGKPFTDPPNLADPTVAQDEWVYHLTRKYGQSGHGGIRYYGMDNEPEIWGNVHRDVRPAYLSYEQMRDIFLEYATAVKDVDPTAVITGPVLWNPANFNYSPLDRGTDNFATHADFNAHHGAPFMQWWLNEVHKHDQGAGRRNLDVLDLHYYPQDFQPGDDFSTAALGAKLLRTTRSLWDPNYTDESWIGKAADASIHKVQLLPRMRAWINANYPGTRLAITEWNWPAEDQPVGGIGMAEVLGIFVRENLDISCHYGPLDAKTPAGLAFKLYGNYDGTGRRFGGTTFSAISTNNPMFSGYTADTGDGAILVMLINKSIDTDFTPQIRVNHASVAFGGAEPNRVRVWRYWPNEMSGIQQGPDITLPASSGPQLTLSYTLPALSMTLLRIEAGA